MHLNNTTDVQGREKSIFHLALFRNICSSFKRGLAPQIPDYQLINELLKGETASASEVMGDRAVRAFLRQTLATRPNYLELNNACETIKGKSLGHLWANYPSVSSGGTKLVEALEEVGSANLSEFVNIACSQSLDDLYERTEKNFNFLASDDSKYSPLYSVSLRGNFIHMIDYDINFNGDDAYDEILHTFDLNGAYHNICSSIDFELNRLSNFIMTGKGLPENTCHRDATYFTDVTIKSNGLDMVTIPLLFDGLDEEMQPGDYSIDFRKNLAAKGGGAYTLDLDNLKVLEASSSDLLKLSRSLPRSAARHLRGAALEDDLGM